MAENKKRILAASVRMVFVLIIISAVSAGVVAAVSSLTAEKIADNLDAEIRRSFEDMFGEGVGYRELDNMPAGAEAVYEITSSGAAYYCVNLNSSGFGGDINILASFDTAGKIVGVSVVSHSETPGLGSRVMDASYTSLFTGRGNADEVDSVAGATISSVALKAGITSARKLLSDAGLIAGVFENYGGEG